MKRIKKIWICLVIMMGFIFLSSLDYMDIRNSVDKITDIDGNIYTSVTIGNQVWMVENLKTTKYTDGKPIQLVTGNPEWSLNISDAYCWYNNDKNNKYIFGALYNWSTVKSNKLCPKGWHVPGDDEWNVLATTLGGENIAGGKLKDKGFAHWSSPNTGATNESGYTALPGGYRNYSGTFDFFGTYGTWWTSTETSSNYAWSRYLKYQHSSVFRYEFNKKYGFSVRCIKN